MFIFYLITYISSIYKNNRNIIKSLLNYKFCFSLLKLDTPVATKRRALGNALCSALWILVLKVSMVSSGKICTTS